MNTGTGRLARLLVLCAVLGLSALVSPDVSAPLARRDFVPAIIGVSIVVVAVKMLLGRR